MMRSLRWLGTVLLFGGLAACGTDDGEPVADGAPETTVTTVRAEASEPSETATETTALRQPAAFAAGASLIATAFSPLDVGTHRVDTTGTQFTFTSDEPLWVQPNGQGHFVLTHPASNGPDDRDIVVLRMSTLSDPSELAPSDDQAADGWPASDFTGWLDSLSNGIEVSNREDTTLGGLDATYVELELGETDCTVARPCLFGTNHKLVGKDLVTGSMYRIWMVDQGAEDPLAVIVGVSREADLEWFDTADDILATMAFDAVAPNPVAVETGTIEVNFLGGIRADLAQSAIIIEESGGFGRIAPGDQPGDAEFLVAPNDLAGNPVTTADGLIAILEEGDVELTEIESTEIGGLEARVFDIGAPQSGPLLTRTADTDVSWTPPPRARVWTVEHPDRGLLVITAEAFTDPDNVFPEILAMTEPIVESMEFIELG